MSGILSAVSSVVTSAASWVGTMAGTFTATVTSGSSTVLANPILLLPLGMLVAGFGVGLIRRLINIK